MAGRRDMGREAQGRCAADRCRADAPGASHEPHLRGALGERMAARYLEDLGCTILERNFRFGRREVDLIVRHDDVVAFVEVKTRAGECYGHPLEAITRLKRREVERVARAWIERYGRPGQRYRFDAVGILLRRDGGSRIWHVPGAWRLGE